LSRFRRINFLSWGRCYDFLKHFRQKMAFLTLTRAKLCKNLNKTCVCCEIESVHGMRCKNIFAISYL
jgi:hypothetical protein